MGGSRMSHLRTLQGRQHTILPNFPKNCMKLRNFWALDPPMGEVSRTPYSNVYMFYRVFWGVLGGFFENIFQIIGWPPLGFDPGTATEI